jgi:hypothetical protein
VLGLQSALNLLVQIHVEVDAGKEVCGVAVQEAFSGSVFFL